MTHDYAAHVKDHRMTHFPRLTRTATRTGGAVSLFAGLALAGPSAAVAAPTPDPAQSNINTPAQQQTEPSVTIRGGGCTNGSANFSAYIVNPSYRPYTFAFTTDTGKAVPPTTTTVAAGAIRDVSLDIPKTASAVYVTSSGKTYASMPVPNCANVSSATSTASSSAYSTQSTTAATPSSSTTTQTPTYRQTPTSTTPESTAIAPSTTTAPSATPSASPSAPSMTSPASAPMSPAPGMNQPAPAPSVTAAPPAKPQSAGPLRLALGIGVCALGIAVGGVALYRSFKR